MRRKLPQVLEPLMKKPHWVIWKWVLNDKERWTKPPFQSRHVGRHASTSDRTTWSTYDEARAAAPGDGGIGFVLKGSGIGAIDIDNCINDQFAINDVTMDLIARSGSYAEVTPSERGVRIIGYTRGPMIKQEHVQLGEGCHAEVYRDCHRYITITGTEVAWGSVPLVYIDDLIDELARRKHKPPPLDEPAKDTSPSGLFYAQVLKWAEQRWAVARMVKELQARPKMYAHTSAARYSEQGRLLEEVERVLSNAGVTTKGESEGSDWQFLTGAELVAGYRPPDYLIEGLLQRGFLYSCTGKTGSGKTALMLLLAALVGGYEGPNPRKPITFDGREIERGRVVYFAGENPDDIRMRWMAMADYFGFEFDDLDVHFVLGRCSLNGDIDRIREKVNEIGGAALVIVDTAIAYFEGDDENSNAQMSMYAREYLRPLTTLMGRPCVVVNCHPTKNVADDNMQPRGGGAFVTEVDTNLVATRRGDTCELHWQTKIRGPEFNPIKFEFVSYGDKLKDSKGRQISTVIARTISEKRYEEKTLKTQNKDNILLKVIVGGPPMSMTQMATKCDWVNSVGLPDKSAVQKSLSRLSNDKMIRRSRGNWVSTKAGKIEAKIRTNGATPPSKT